MGRKKQQLEVITSVRRVEMVDPAQIERWHRSTDLLLKLLDRLEAQERAGQSNLEAACTPSISTPDRSPQRSSCSSFSPQTGRGRSGLV
jgi:hypothetical protein